MLSNLNSPDYESPGGRKVLFITMMPNFLGTLCKLLQENGYKTRVLLIPSSLSDVNKAQIVRECDLADILFCEFVQFPMDFVTTIAVGKPIFARLWRCELYNSQYFDTVYWNKVNALFYPTESALKKFKIARKGKLEPKKYVKFQAPSIDFEEFPLMERDFSSEFCDLALLGNVIPRKRALLACQLLLDLPENVRLSIGGALKDQEYITHIRDFVEKNALTSRVRILGEISRGRRSQFFKDHHLILSLSSEETGHYAVAEGMASGCYPVVSTWADSAEIYPPEFVQNSLKDLLEAILTWHSLSSEEKNTLSLYARDTAETLFSYTKADYSILETLNTC